MTGLLVFVSGPSGVGKSTVCRRLSQVLPAEFAVSLTTRTEKPQDSKGKRYVFVNEAEFRRQLEAGELLEYAFKFGNWYGTLRKPVETALKAGRTVLLEIEVQGAIQVHDIYHRESLGVFILPPSEQSLLERLRERGREDEPTIMRRFAEAKQEIRSAETSGAYDLMVVNPDNGVEHTVEEIQKAVRRRRGDNEPGLFDD